MFRLERRLERSTALLYVTPLMAVVLTLVSGFILFTILGQDAGRAMMLIFVEPLTSYYSLSELVVKATPLVLIAIGLSIGFRAGVWNIGAEGQFTIGALTGGAVALALYDIEGVWVLPLMVIAGTLGGMAWGAVPAFLRTRFGTNEILVSLMLTYVATLLLSVLVHGPLRDPDGLNFPESRIFHDAATLPIVLESTRAHIGAIVALVVVAAATVFLGRHMAGFQVKVYGQAPDAARFAGFSGKAIVWLCFAISGGLAGMAGLFEVSGPIGQLVPAVPVGYGFTAIIVAFLGRLNPVGILLAGLLLALTYIGGENAQISMSLPSAVTSVFQGLLLFFLLASDVLVSYRVRRVHRAAPATGAAATPSPAPAE